jgi:hypothetical protein
VERNEGLTGADGLVVDHHTAGIDVAFLEVVVVGGGGNGLGALRGSGAR